MDQLHGVLSSSEAWLLAAQLFLFISHLAAAIAGRLAATQAAATPSVHSAAESLLMDYLASSAAHNSDQDRRPIG